MSERTTLTCDVCGKDRAEVNGWWSYRTDEREFHAGHADGKKGRYHACGHLCLHKALDAYLTLQAATVPIPEPPTQTEQEFHTKEEPESLIKGKGLTVEALVAEQGGNPAEAVHVKQELLPEADPDEEVRLIELEKPFADDTQIDIPFDEENTQPGEPEKRE
jgi:hypothetical protein